MTNAVTIGRVAVLRCCTTVGPGSAGVGSNAPLWLRFSLVPSVRTSDVIMIIWHGSHGFQVADACSVETWRGLADRGCPGLVNACRLLRLRLGRQSPDPGIQPVH